MTLINDTQRVLTHIDLFAGPGGVSTGFRAAGIKTLAAVEKVKSCVDTFSKNHPDVLVIHKDIREVTKNDFSNINSNIDFITAGVPCETFSTAGSKSRSFYDYRQTLFNDAIRIACYFNANYILIENVPAILTKKIEKGSRIRVVDLLYQNLIEAGYTNINTVILNSQDFGVPQKRERFFCIASKSDKIIRTPHKSNFPKFNVLDAISDLPALKANIQTQSAYLNSSNAYAKLMKDDIFWRMPFTSSNIPSYHNAPNHRQNTLKRFSLIKQGEGLKDIFDRLGPTKVEKLQAEGVLPKKWYIQRNRRLIPSNPSPTVTSHCLDELLHYEQNRALSVREVARLQSFPDSYDFAGGPYICPHMYETQDKYEQIGDAIPPLLAYHWGLALMETEFNASTTHTSTTSGGQLRLII